MVLDVIGELTLNINKNNIVSILAPSGSGKTTLLRIITGLLKSFSPNSKVEGEVSIFGKPPEFWISMRKIGFAFQNPVLLPWRTVVENIELPLELSKEKKLNHTKELLSLMKLSDYSTFYSTALSGGLQQRVNLARSLINDPILLLLDEPFRGLDILTREELISDLYTILKEKKITTVFVTHDIDDAIQMSNEVIVFTDKPMSIKKTITVDAIDRTPEFKETRCFLDKVIEVKKIMKE